MLFYLRIQADSYAGLSSCLYAPIEHPNERVDDKSFRSHREWFNNARHKDFDAAYASILDDHFEWFELLSGKDPKGLRDVLVHHSGVTKYEWVKENADSPWKIRGGLYRSDGPREDDLFEALRTMTSGWCKFLDAVYNHFTERFVEAGFLPAGPCEIHSHSAVNGRQVRCPIAQMGVSINRRGKVKRISELHSWLRRTSSWCFLRSPIARRWGQASCQRLAQSSPPFPGKRSASP
jgi:hypothetical protein